MSTFALKLSGKADSSIYKDIIFNILFVAFFIIVNSFGFVLKANVIGVWYIVSLYFFINRKYLHLFSLYIIFSYFNLGLYQYGFFGSDKEVIIYKLIDEFLLGLMLLGTLQIKQKLNDLSKKILFAGIPLLIIALISGFINMIDPIDFINYFLTTMRWFFLLYILLKFNFNKAEFTKLITLIVIIIIFNSIFGTLQTLVLPIQPSPDGYVPHFLDVASGFFGITASNYVTILCLSFTFFFFLMYLVQKSTFYLFISMLLFLQPIFSSSKSVIIIIGLLISLFVVVYFIFFSTNKNRLKGLFAMPILLFIIVIGYEYFQELNYRYFGKIDVTIEKYFNTRRSIQDFQKIQGYFEAANLVAPSGNLGASFGAGPTSFISFVGLKKDTKWIKNLGLSNETTQYSSTDFRGTDIAGIIGELGYFGILAFFYMFFRLVYISIKGITLNKMSLIFVYRYFTVFYLFVLLAFSFYYYGWFFHFLYLPLIVLLGIISRNDEF